jgi:hypothetical protein
MSVEPGNTRDPIRWPIEPLKAAMHESDPAANALRCGVSERAVHRWALAGLTDETADRVALRAGYMPEEIWVNWLDDRAGRLLATIRWQAEAKVGAA